MKKSLIYAVIGGILLLGGLMSTYLFRSEPAKFNIKQAIQTAEMPLEASVAAQATEEGKPEVAEPSLKDNLASEHNERVAVEETGLETKKDSNIGNTNKIVQKFVSWGFEKATGRKIEAIIIHSSYDALGQEPYDTSGLIAEYKSYSVSPHYLIDREGKIYQLVADQNIAYHAGAAKLPDGRTNVNELSLGIEIMNTKEDKITGAQYSALNALLKDLEAAHAPKFVLGHDQVAPGRKDDPWNLDWDKINK